MNKPLYEKASRPRKISTIRAALAIRIQSVLLAGCLCLAFASGPGCERDNSADSLGRRNLAGGIAATVGNAHAVERMTFAGSIVAGNTIVQLGLRGDVVATLPHDIFTGSLRHRRFTANVDLVDDGPAAAGDEKKDYVGDFVRPDEFRPVEIGTGP